MIDALLISNGVLWLLVIGLALTVLALTRQIGERFDIRAHRDAAAAKSEEEAEPLDQEK